MQIDREIQGVICEVCLDQLRKSYAFVEQCQHTYPLLQNILRVEKTVEFPEIQMPPDPGIPVESVELPQQKFYHVPIKKRFYAARKEPTKAVVDIEDIVPVQSDVQPIPKDDCKDCCLESTNICLQKINTNLDENHNSDPPNFGSTGNFAFSIENMLRKDDVNLSSTVNFTSKTENLTNFEISSESLLDQNFDLPSPNLSKNLLENFEEDQESMLDLESPSSIGNLVKVEPSDFDPTSSENLLDFSKSGSGIFDFTARKIKEEHLEDAENSRNKKQKKTNPFTVHCDEPGCKNSFKSEENRKIHKILYHSNLINEANQCIYCDKKFDKKKLLK